jgi:hypothetical protein
VSRRDLTYTIRSDMCSSNSLNVKLGHRRACAISILKFLSSLRSSDNFMALLLTYQQQLQRAIVASRGHALNYRPRIASSKSTGSPRSYRNKDFPPDRKGEQDATSAHRIAGSSTKRRYKRRPKVSIVQANHVYV